MTSPLCASTWTLTVRPHNYLITHGQKPLRVIFAIIKLRLAVAGSHDVSRTKPLFSYDDDDDAYTDAMVNDDNKCMPAFLEIHVLTYIALIHG